MPLLHKMLSLLSGIVTVRDLPLHRQPPICSDYAVSNEADSEDGEYAQRCRNNRYRLKAVNRSVKILMASAVGYKTGARHMGGTRPCSFLCLSLHYPRRGPVLALLLTRSQTLLVKIISNFELVPSAIRFLTFYVTASNGFCNPCGRYLKFDSDSSHEKHEPVTMTLNPFTQSAWPPICFGR